MNWPEFAAAAPDLAEAGRARLDGRTCYLATIRTDGSPRVHPVTPDLTANGLYVFMEPSSPKGHDLGRDPRYALHANVEDTGGGLAEFLVSGRAKLVESPAERARAASASAATGHAPADRYILFALAIEHAMLTTYVDGVPVRVRWDMPED